MKIYFGEGALKKVEELFLPLGVKNALVSYWYDNKPENYIDFHNKYPDVSIMVDSGAYSAMTQKGRIALEPYIEFALKIQDSVDWIVALDVIGDPEESKENYLKMIQQGVSKEKLMGVYHATEPWNYLEFYLKACKIMGVGTSALKRGELRKYMNHVNQIFSRIKGNTKIHMLGLNAPKVMYALGGKIYSTDSTSMSDSFAGRNVSFRYSGMNLCIQGYNKDKITPMDRKMLAQYNINRTLKAEQEINEYVEMRCQKQ